jgi:uncharacterized protein (DUF885 family)
MCLLDPSLATSVGEPGVDDELPDVSPDGMAARVDLARRTLAELAKLADVDDADRLCRDLMEDRLGVSIEQFETGEHLRYLRVIGSPVGSIRAVFDQMSKDTADDWEHIANRLDAIPQAYGGIKVALEHGISQGLFAASRQAIACADQLDAWAATNGGTRFFDRYCTGAPSGVAARLDAGSATAAAAFGELAHWLRTDYAAAAEHQPDAVGLDRYRLGVRQFLGADLDPIEAYDWAWEELNSIETEMRQVCNEILPGASIEETYEHLDATGEAMEGEEDLRQWLQDLMDDTATALHGTHFDLPDELRTIEAMIAPPGSAAAQYYSPPTADFNRPGRTWYPTLGKTRFPIWGEVSTCYHEGVPGHHLQIAQWLYEAPRTSKFQTYMYVSGNIEGWALYSERLMDELGFLRNPGERLGYLVAQQLRATRVIVDIGMHLSLPIPAGQPFHPGTKWSAELGRDFLAQHAGKDTSFMDSEWVRYLGWPAQAICYKLGERVWLAGREAAKQRAAAAGETFDLKAWHTRALAMGSTTLRLLQTEL